MWGACAAAARKGIAAGRPPLIRRLCRQFPPRGKPFQSAVPPPIEHCTCASVTEHFQQNRVGHAAIDDDGLVDALVDGVGHALDLGQHAARNDACGLVALDFGDFDLGDQRGFIVLIVEFYRNLRLGRSEKSFGFCFSE